MNKFDVPVFMYHSIGIPDKKWNWNYLTCPYDRFEEQLKAIQSAGYKTISSQTLYEYMVNGKELPSKSIVLNFDDGYADIWIYAYPLLKKYGMCATVFINPEFVDKRKIKRQTYSENSKVDELENIGFLSWDEIITMDKEGVVFSESHALTHTWYPKTNKIIDFRNPEDDYTWMTWNKYPELKPNLQIDNKKLVNFGTPVYESEKSLSSSRYFPDAKLDTRIETYVSNHGGIDFFKQNDWRKILFNEVELFKKSNVIEDKYEDQETYSNRIRYELKYTKDLLEEKLNREITFLCWPGGSATNIGMTIAKDLGYKFFNTARDLPVEKRNSVRNVRSGGERIRRFTPFFYWDGKESRNSRTIYANKTWTKLLLLRYSGKYFSKYWFKILTLIVNGYFRIFKNSSN
jgi:hypothetical protein